MNAPAKAARTPRRRLKSTSTLWGGISRPPCSRFPWPRRNKKNCGRRRNAKTDFTRTTCAAKQTASRRNGKNATTPGARRKWRQQRPRSGPRIWRKAFFPPSASYPGGSRARQQYRPVPQFNHHSAKENEHERIDLHPLRRLLHPRPETFRAAGGRHRQVWPYAATLPEGTPARALQQLDFERKAVPAPVGD